MGLFGESFEIIDDTELPAELRTHPADYAAWVRLQLKQLRPGEKSILRLRRPRPTAAFSPRDTIHLNYVRATEQARARGFVPVERGTGGRLTMFDENALGITIIAPHKSPHEHMMERYNVLSNAIVKGLESLGLDARIGELPNEYCPGKFSINAEGRIKLVGVAQRMNSYCVQMGAVISVKRSEKACAGIAEAYKTLGLTFDPATYGGVTDFQKSVTFRDVHNAMMASLNKTLLH
jgi:octanoyl-[GcvH]:protein N-octanoyltransferase